jgi:hypothetical protein
MRSGHSARSEHAGGRSGNTICVDNVGIPAKLLSGIFRPFSPIYLENAREVSD